jgi:integrase
MGRKFKRGNVWWVSYYHNGQEIRESTGSENESAAKDLLKKRLGEIGKGRLIGPKAEKVRFDELAEDLLTDYRINAKRSVRSAELSISHLKTFFSMDKAPQITTDRIKRYIARRQEEGASNASINRELSALGRMFTLAIQAEKLATRPYIPRLDENNARQGFLDHGSFLALIDSLPEYLRDPVRFLYFSGWRVSEMKALEWRDVDLAGKVVRLRPEISKNKDGRVLPLAGELLEIIEKAREARRLDCVRVFHNRAEPIGDFRKSWKKACKAAGLKALVHDMRRTAVRNMVRAGINEKVAMSLSGHKTRSVFDRYNIVSEDDLARAAERLQSHLQAQTETPVVTPIKKAV